MTHIAQTFTLQELNRVLRLIQAGQTTTGPTGATPADLGGFTSFNLGSNTSPSSLSSALIYPLLTDGAGALVTDTEGFLELDPIVVARYS